MVTDFRDTILPEISHKIIIISSLYEDPKMDLMLEILANEHVIHWFGIDIHIDHPKVTPIPLGITHSVAKHFGEWNHLRYE